jgi:hypothetical protein
MGDRRKFMKGVVKELTIFGFAVLLVVVLYQFGKAQTLPKTDNTVHTTATPVTLSTAKPKVEGATTTKIQPVTDTDPIVDCKFTHTGTMKLKSSVCSKSTDCQIGDKWYYYDSVAKCKADQNNYTAAYNRVYSNPFITCVVTYSCTGKSYTYQVSQTTCNSFQQQAINTCNTSNNDTSLQSAIDQMYSHILTIRSPQPHL